MTHIKDKEAARDLSDNSLYRFMAGNCPNCAIIAHAVLNGRAKAKSADEKASERHTNTERQKAGGQFVNARPKARTAHDLSFLIRDKSGESVPLVVKDVDSKTLHDILDRADEIVISRVDAR